MQALTSSFPSSTRSHNGVQLDNIIFYSGPASAKTRETTPIDADEWSDIDMIFAEEWVATTEQLDPTGGFDITREDIRNAIDPSSAAQATMPLPAHLEDVSTPLCNPFDHSHGGVADNGGFAKSQEPLDVWGTQMKSVPVGTSNTAQLDVKLNSGDVGVAVRGCPPDDGASLALWEAFRGEVSTSAPATDHPTSSSRFLEMGGPNLPLHTAGLSPVGRNIDIAPSDKTPFEEGNCVQQPQLNDDRERNSAATAVIESSMVEQDPTSRAACDTCEYGPFRGFNVRPSAILPQR